MRSLIVFTFSAVFINFSYCQDCCCFEKNRYVNYEQNRKYATGCKIGDYVIRYDIAIEDTLSEFKKKYIKSANYEYIGKGIIYVVNGIIQEGFIDSLYFYRERIVFIPDSFLIK